MEHTPVGDLMTEPVLTVNATDSVRAVGKAMREKGIKSVVVIDESCQPKGILTSTDFVEIATTDVDITDSTVEDWMTSGIYTVSRSEAVPVAVDEMLAREISHLPVVDDDGTVVGILSMTDIVTEHATGTQDLAEL
ncbi:MAG: CBS domain-containing protein [Natronomonas sp.]